MPKTSIRFIFIFFVSIVPQCLKAQPGCIGFNADFDFNVDNSAPYHPYAINFKNTSVWTDSSTVFRWIYSSGANEVKKEGRRIFNGIGTYRVTLFAVSKKTNGDTVCRDSAWKQVQIAPDTCLAVLPNFIVTEENNCSTLRLTPQTPFLNYVWQFANGDSSASNTVVRNFGAKGKYNVCLKTSYPYSTNRICQSTHCDTVLVCATLSVGKQILPVVALYPNPAQQWLTIETPNINANVCVLLTDVLGRQVYTHNYTHTAQIDMSGLNNGIYFVTLFAQGIQFHHQKILKQ